MTGLAERLRSECMEQGRQQDEQTLLGKLLERHFGPLDAETEQRLQQATTDELERWAENLRDAQSLAEVFGEGQSSQYCQPTTHPQAAGVESAACSVIRRVAAGEA